MAPRVTLIVAVRDQLSLTRACLDSLRSTSEPFRLLVVDHGSTDSTPAFFEKVPYRFPLRYERVPSDTPIVAALNRACRLADTDFLCLLHNDTEIVEPDWLRRLLSAVRASGVGLAGLYGVKRLRRDGRYVGRTIVHSLADGPTVRAPWEEVSVVDAVCLCLARRLMESLGGFDEGYGFHGIDRDLSFSVRERGHRCVVVHAPFRHRGGGTRTHNFAVEAESERADLARRRAALARFAAKWAHRLPCDVRPLGERFTNWMSAKSNGWRGRRRGLRATKRRVETPR